VQEGGWDFFSRQFLKSMLYLKQGGIKIMPYEVLEQKISSLTLEQQQSVFDFINFLLYKNQSSKNKKQIRQPGGLEGNLYMAPDFDETPDCFKDYM
jgi:hypothetical protein